MIGGKFGIINVEGDIFVAFEIFPFFVTIVVVSKILFG
jgi:hypothetical protein